MAPENLPLVSTYTIGWFEGLTPTDTKTYTYGNTSWPDLLTAYDGDSITYDAIGNPTSYRGASMTRSGRRLSSYSKSGVTVSYVYNESGIRTQKTVDGTTTEYFLSGSTILAEKTGSNITWYLYDSLGNPVGYEYGGAKYWYITNLQGDILYVVNSAGTPIGSYTYSPYGDFTATVLSSSDSTAFSANHLTYRGYYYDAETGLYYLGSRYYDAQVGRFISSDTVDVVSTASTAITDKNLFAYCDNNPINRADDGGEFWHIVAGAVIGAIGGAASTMISQLISGGSVNWTAVAISAASGAISGAVTAACPCLGPVATGMFQGTLSAATYAATEKFAYGRNPTLKDTLKVGVTSGIMAGGAKYLAQNKGLVQCFVAGTLVATKEGLVPIEEIEPGDYVYATDETTGKTALKEVKQVFRNETDEWIHVTVNGEEIICTPGHPFYSPVKGWTSACQLRAGDILVNLNGEYVIVEQVQHELLESPETTYNFEVEGFHTYYVGSAEVLVHNMCKSASDDFLPLSNNQEATQVAQKMGYSPTKNISNGQKVFVNKSAPQSLRYITRDFDSHNGGVWKAAKTIKDLGSRVTRSGTYSRWLNIRIGG